MSFERYVARAQGFRAAQEGYITISKTRIGLGYYQPPWKYVVILFDRTDPAIKFTKGHSGNGFKVLKNANTWSLSAASFTKKQLLPYGLYKKVDENTFKLVELQTSDEDNKETIQ